MPTAVAIQERILRQIRTDVAAITGIGDVVRFAASGKWWSGSAWIENLEDGDALVVFQGEQELEQSIGDDTAPVLLQMDVAVAVLIGKAETATTYTDSVARNWNALVRQKLMTNPRIVETATSVRLAVDSRIVNVPDLTTAEGQKETSSFTFLEVDYRIERNNPFRLGSAIAQVEE